MFGILAHITTTKEEIDSMNFTELKVKAYEIRKQTIIGVSKAGSGHPGGALSIAEILSVLYFDKMNIDPKKPAMPNRDRLVLSKGHAAPSYYGALALKEYFDVKEIENLRQIDSILQGHPDMKRIPGVDMSSGSLGQGLSAANGMALYAKTKGMSYHVYVIIGDGECQEGQVWEASMAAAHYKLDNVTAFIDLNGLQIDGCVKDIMNNASLIEKFKAFGWNTIEIDGNSVEEISKAIDEAKSFKSKPTAIFCNTVKGKGVSFMEGQCGWHGAAPNEEQTKIALKDIETSINQIKEVQ